MEITRIVRKPEEETITITPYTSYKKDDVRFYDRVKWLVDNTTLIASDCVHHNLINFFSEENHINGTNRKDVEEIMVLNTEKYIRDFGILVIKIQWKDIFSIVTLKIKGND